MRMTKMKIKNFRGYQEETTVDFNQFTAFVGKNDSGKSTILEALDLFFNEGKGVVKFDEGDLNVEAKKKNDRTVQLVVCFSDLPERIVLDETNETSFKAEYLLNENEELEIVKRYTVTDKTGTCKTTIFIRARHPSNPKCANLLSKKSDELKKIIEKESVECKDKTRNAVMRNAIWQHYAEQLKLEIHELDVTKGDTKSIWEKVQRTLPLFSLFQSDRKNDDSDDEVQDPLKVALKQILQDESLQKTLTDVAIQVSERLTDVATRTLKKLQEMNPEIAQTLTPNIPAARQLKWENVFKDISITADQGIPINKHGSGTKRLILLNFFRAEVERKKTEGEGKSSVIYAFEEPETSQHTDNQRMLVHALKELSHNTDTQVIMTTHSATIVKELEYEDLRLIKPEDGKRTIRSIQQHQLPYPSLNEVNYIAFDEISTEYHDELYAHLKERKLWGSYVKKKKQYPYIKLLDDGKEIQISVIRTQIIRDQIHHPENTLNKRFTNEQLRESIKAMRDFIIQNKTGNSHS